MEGNVMTRTEPSPPMSATIMTMTVMQTYVEADPSHLPPGASLVEILPAQSYTTSPYRAVIQSYHVSNT